MLGAIVWKWFVVVTFFLAVPMLCLFVVQADQDKTPKEQVLYGQFNSFKLLAGPAKTLLFKKESTIDPITNECEFKVGRHRFTCPTNKKIVYLPTNYENKDGSGRKIVTPNYFIFLTIDFDLIDVKITYTDDEIKKIEVLKLKKEQKQDAFK